MDVHVFGRAAAAWAKNARGVRLVEQEHRAMAVGHFGQLRQGAQIAVHAEEAIADNQPATMLSRPRQQAVQLFPIAVGIDANVGPGQAAAVPKAGVILGVGVDRVAGADQGRDRPQVCGKAGREEQGGFGPFELGQ